MSTYCTAGFLELFLNDRKLPAMAENVSQNTQGLMFDVKLNKAAKFDDCYL